MLETDTEFEDLILLKIVTLSFFGDEYSFYS
jgi:hypothetical protein